MDDYYWNPGPFSPLSTLMGFWPPNWLWLIPGIWALMSGDYPYVTLGGEM